MIGSKLAKRSNIWCEHVWGHGNDKRLQVEGQSKKSQQKREIEQEIMKLLKHESVKYRKHSRKSHEDLKN